MPEPSTEQRRRYAVLVPVKPPTFAKSRLASVGDSVRVRLAAAFAADTVAAALDCRAVARVLVVTDDHVLAGAMTELGAGVLPDGMSDDLNGTLVQAAAEVHRQEPDLALAALCADLPALRSQQLDEALASADPARMSFVADSQGVGTTAVVAPGIDAFRPSFGEGSRRQHLDAGAIEIDVEVPTLRRDVDDADDLVEALALGVGPRTSLVVTTSRLWP